MNKPLQWEYHLQPLPGDFKLIAPTLSELGALGWELICLQVIALNGVQMFFKRPVNISEGSQLAGVRKVMKKAGRI